MSNDFAVNWLFVIFSTYVVLSVDRQPRRERMPQSVIAFFTSFITWKMYFLRRRQSKMYNSRVSFSYLLFSYKVFIQDCRSHSDNNYWYFVRYWKVISLCGGTNLIYSLPAATYDWLIDFDLGTKTTVLAGFISLSIDFLSRTFDTEDQSFEGRMLIV